MFTRKVLVISDDADGGEIWCNILRDRGAQISLFAPLELSDETWLDQSFDVIVMDIYSSELNTMSIIQNLRNMVTIPILLLMPTNNETVALAAYDAGVDEYVTKPISPRLFLAKVSVWITRSQTVPTSLLDNFQVGDLRLEPAQRQLEKADGSSVKLTNLEFRLLHLLMCHPNQILESRVLIDRVWGHVDVGGDATLVKNVVYRLRRKIEPDPAQPRYIRSVTGEGYMFQP